MIDDLKFLIKSCLNLELYDEAFEYTNKLVDLNELSMNDEERNLFMKAAKAKFNFYRNGWKNLLDFEQSDPENNLMPKEFTDMHMQNLESEIKNFCMEMDSTIEALLNKTLNDDFLGQIFYKKLKADYLRYYSEVANEDEFSNFVDTCQELYEWSMTKCNEELEPHNPLTLSVALNYSVFAYFILDDTNRAFKIADQAYKQAMLKFNIDQKIPEVESLIKSIEENLTIWKIELFDIN